MGVPEPDATWYTHFRKRSEQRLFYAAFAVSAALHLSMVTIFSIVIHFPRQDIVYRDFKIVPIKARAAVGDVESGSAGESGSGDQLLLRGEGGPSPLRDIQLPTLEFAELERLRVRQEGIETLSSYDDIFKEPPADSWARFSRGLSGMSRSLSQLRLSGAGDDARPSLLGGDAPERIVHRPARGFEAQLVWTSAPRDRQLLFAPPIEALWGAEADALQRPVELVIDVNALGRVVNVFIPTVDDNELVDAIQIAVLRYRFEPLALENAASQTATLRIGRDTSEGNP